MSAPVQAIAADDCRFRWMPTALSLEKTESMLFHMETCLEDPTLTTTITLSGPGGDPNAASAFYDIIQMSNRGKLHTIAVGMVGSAMIPLFLAGTHRSMMPNARLLIHDGSFYLDAGWYDDNKLDEVRRIKKQSDLIYEKMISDATGIDIVAVQKLVDVGSVYTAEEAIEAGFAHNVLTRN